MFLLPLRLLALLGALVALAPHQSQFEVQAQDRPEDKQPINRLLVMTVAREPDNSESFKRFNRSIETYKLDLSVLLSKGGKRQDEDELQLYRRALASYKDDHQLAVMLVDGEQTIVNGGKEEILRRLTSGKSFQDRRILLSADSRCWPDSKLAAQYPPIPEAGGQRFLNSRALIGRAPHLHELLQSMDGDDDGSSKTSLDRWQARFTRAYLDADKRKRLGMELDHRAELFQALNPSESDVELEFDADSVRLRSQLYRTEPLVVHGNKGSQVVLNSLGNYLAKAWTLRDGCRYCNESLAWLAPKKDHELPRLLMGVFIEEPTPFLDDFLQNLIDLNYPRDRIHLFLHTNVAYHQPQVDKFLEAAARQEDGSPNFASQQVVKSYNNSTSSMELAEWEARDLGLAKCRELGCDYYLSLDSIAHLELNDTIRHLIETNKSVVAPLLSRPTKLWSNFWGSLTDDGYYARSHDYVALVKRERQGLWNVPLVTNAYLLEGRLLRRHLSPEAPLSERLTYQPPEDSPTLKPTLAFARRLRELSIDQFMVNTHDFGHLVDAGTYNISLEHPDFYQLRENVLDWERRYIHDNYSQQLEEAHKLEQPCQDVFWFPLVNDLFCSHLLDIMHKFGQWSGGTNHDPRIEGGYESVPTRDIHMRQVGLHDMWLHFIREYVMPIQLKEFIGYEHDPPGAALAFVVRYHPEEQPSLRPHHDASTYTLNIALNEPGENYSGGGCRFVRYNCSVTQSRKGWALIHPGRLTHYHEGLPVTNGTRYIMVTFVDP